MITEIFIIWYIINIKYESNQNGPSNYIYNCILYIFYIMYYILYTHTYIYLYYTNYIIHIYQQLLKLNYL